METTDTTTPTTTPLNEWITIKQLEEDYFIKASTQNKMRMAGTIPFSKVGGLVRYSRTKINKMFEDAEIVK